MKRFTASEVVVTVREDVHHARLWVSWRGRSPYFDELKGMFRSCFPTHASCIYSRQQRAWSLPITERARVEWFLEQHVEGSAVAWVVEPTGSTYSSSNNTGWGQWKGGDQQGDGAHRGHRGHADRRVSSPLEKALEVLHLRTTAPSWAAEAVYKAAIKRMHPDHGGDHASACALTEAIATIRKEAS
jgi:hypothetical protein